MKLMADVTTPEWRAQLQRKVDHLHRINDPNYEYTPSELRDLGLDIEGVRCTHTRRTGSGRIFYRQGESMLWQPDGYKGPCDRGGEHGFYFTNGRIILLADQLEATEVPEEPSGKWLTRKWRTSDLTACEKNNWRIEITAIPSNKHGDFSPFGKLVMSSTGLAYFQPDGYLPSEPGCVGFRGVTGTDRPGLPELSWRFVEADRHIWCSTDPINTTNDRSGSAGEKENDMFRIETARTKAGYVGQVISDYTGGILWESEPQVDELNKNGEIKVIAVTLAVRAAEAKRDEVLAELFTTKPSTTARKR